jgi:hypothetical protein
MSDQELEKECQSYVKSFERIQLHEIGTSSFMDRLDRKFLLNEDEIRRLVSGLESDYRVVEAAKSCCSPYHTKYFDTPDYKFFSDHHKGKGFRTKIRYRSYPRTKTNFLEVKHKNNKGRTSKSRIPVESTSSDFAKPEREFLAASAYDPGTDELIHAVTIDYLRLAFISRDHEERFSIDFRMTAHRKGQSISFGNLAVAEIKQYRYHTSAVVERLREMGCLESSMSKYCLSLSLLEPKLKANNFKPTLQRIRKINHEAIFDENI